MSYIWGKSMISQIVMKLELYFSELKKYGFSNLQMQDTKSLQETDHETISKSDGDHPKYQLDVKLALFIPLLLSA